MSNVIAFRPDQRGKAVADQGADRGRILLFTGIRYLREEADTESRRDADAVLRGADAADAAAATERLKA